MKYRKKPVVFKYPVAELLQADILENLCRRFGINHKRLFNRIEAQKEKLTYGDYKKLMETPPRGGMC